MCKTWTALVREKAAATLLHSISLTHAAQKLTTCKNVTYTLFFFCCKYSTKHPTTAHWSYPTIQACTLSTHIQRPLTKVFKLPLLSLGTSACTRQAIYWALVLPFPVQFPSWHYWWSVSFPSSSPAWGRFNSLTSTVWLHLPPSLNLNFLPAQTTHQKKTTYPRQTGSSSPNDCLSRPMGLSSEHWNTAAWPGGCLSPQVLLIQPISEWACRSFYMERGVLTVSWLEGWQHMWGKHLTSVFHPGQQESKQSFTCRGRCPLSQLHIHSSQCILPLWTAALWCRLAFLLDRKERDGAKWKCNVSTRLCAVKLWRATDQKFRCPFGSTLTSYIQPVVTCKLCKRWHVVRVIGQYMCLLRDALGRLLDALIVRVLHSKNKDGRLFITYLFHFHQQSCMATVSLTLSFFSSCRII